MQDVSEIRLNPVNGWILVAPIKTRESKDWIEVVGQEAAAQAGQVVRTSGTLFKPGDIVWYQRGLCCSIALERAVLYKMMEEKHVIGHATEADYEAIHGKIEWVAYIPKTFKKDHESRMAQAALAQGVGNGVFTG